ncbi:MAG: TIGR02556 family CRISPR-associated protein [candidate division WOR-3 bacterium]
MLTAIARIGELIKNQGKQTDSPKIKPDTEQRILSILLEYKPESNSMKFSRLTLEDMDFNKAKQTLLDFTNSKGNNPSPIAALTTPEKAFRKIQTWFKKSTEYLKSVRDENWQLSEQIANVLKTEEKTILKEINSKFDALKKDDKKKKTVTFLTVKISGDLSNYIKGETFQQDPMIPTKDNAELPKSEFFIGDIPSFKSCALQLENKRTTRSGSIGTCSVCGTSGVKVFARTYIFQFDTDDKPGFIPGGFNKKTNWKNIPVCEKCRENLKLGRDFIERELSYKFYDLNYWLIPQLMTSDNTYLHDILQILSKSEVKKTRVEESKKKALTNDENEVFDILSQEKDILTVNLLFIKEEQSAERIQLLIQDIYPSRLRQIFNAKDEVDNILTGVPFNFGVFREFFKKTDEKRRDNDLDKYFLTITESVFKNKPLSYPFLLKFIMTRLRKEFLKLGTDKEDKGFYQLTQKAFLGVLFLLKLGILEKKGGQTMVERDAESILAKYEDGLNTPLKKGLFLLGVLTQKLLDIQQRERDSKPFLKKLKGLKLRKNDINSLFTDLRIKFEEYKALTPVEEWLFSRVSSYLLQGGENWDLTTDEVNFYIATGMSLKNEIYNKIFKKEDVQNA